MLAELHGDAPSEVNDSRLCRSVCQRARIASLPTGDAAVVDYAARLLRHHNRRYVLHAEHRSELN